MMFKRRTLLIIILLILLPYVIWDIYQTFYWPSYPFAKKAIVIGASSGIGKAIAQVLAKNGWQVGLVARRLPLLEDLSKELPTKSYIKQIDIAQIDQARASVQELINEMGGANLIILNSAIGKRDDQIDWSLRKQMIEVNALGFAAMADAALNHFRQQMQGHLVGITSIAALRGGKHAYTYCATKAFESTLLEGIRNTVNTYKLPIYVTDIKPGFVDTDMVKDNPNKFWEASPMQAAEQIYDAILKRKKYAYVTKRWLLIAWVIKWAPDWLYDLVAR